MSGAANCQGPCLAHCSVCDGCAPATLTFARASMVYLIACVVYWLASRCMGTPFGDSLSPEQKELKRESAAARGKLFVAGLVTGVLVIVAWKPFLKKKHE